MFWTRPTCLQGTHVLVVCHCDVCCRRQTSKSAQHCNFTAHYGCAGSAAESCGNSPQPALAASVCRLLYQVSDVTQSRHQREHFCPKPQMLCDQQLYRALKGTKGGCWIAVLQMQNTPSQIAAGIHCRPGEVQLAKTTLKYNASSSLLWISCL